MKKAMLLSLALMMGVGNVALAQQCTDLIDVRMNDTDGVPLMMDQIITVCATITVGHEFGSNGPGYMQDATGAVAIYGGDFYNSGHQIGDVVEVLAEVEFYRGLTQMRYASSIELVDSGVFVAPLALDLATFSADPEFFEARLVKFTGVTLSDPENWPAEGSNSNMTIEQGGYSLTMRVDGDTDIDGSTVPGAAFDVTGIISQYDSSTPYHDGYQIIPRMLTDFDFGGAVVDVDSQPADFQLLGAFPNPFNPTTTIEFTLNSTQNVHLSVLDIMGREVAVLSDGMTESGSHQIAFDGAHLSSGLYFTCLKGESQMQVSKMMLIK
jgi:hypothetical protein